jgi:hypothetical protein
LHWQVPKEAEDDAAEAASLVPIEDLSEGDTHVLGIQLAARLSDPDIQVFLAAMECLGDHVLEFVPLIAGRLDDESKDIRLASLVTIFELGRAQHYTPYIGTIHCTHYTLYSLHPVHRYYTLYSLYTVLTTPRT